MIESLFCFGMAFLVQGIVVAFVMEYFGELSNRRGRGEITEFEKWMQGCISLPARPILEAILAKDPVGIRVIISICLGISAVIALIFTTSDGLIIAIAIVLLIAIWVSYSS